jgi:large subunit ribosomal protein L25
MAEIGELQVAARAIGTKGAVRALRLGGRVPGIVYGQGGMSQPISLDRYTLVKEIERGGFMNRLYDLKLGDEVQRVLPRDVQFHVVTDRPMHVDFLRLSDDTELHLEIPVHFINEAASPGIGAGGILNIVRHAIEVVCRAASIPEHIVVDLTGRDVGDSIHISAVTLPEGVRAAITGRDFTIATIASPTVHVEAEPAAEEVEGEAVVGEAEPKPEEE